MKGAKPMKHISRTRRGAVAVLIAVSLTGMLAVMAFALDGGLLQDKRRAVQAAADAAALAASDDMWAHYGTNNGTDPDGTALASALATASADGYNNDSTTNRITVNSPPASGNFAGKAGYAEVIIQYNEPRFFSGIFGSGTMAVKARSVSGGQPGNVGILMLDPHLTIVAQIGDNVNILNGGGIFINSDATVKGDINEGPYAIYLESTAHITTGGIYTVGPLGREAGSTITYTNGGSLHTCVTPLSDPLASVPEPVVPAGTKQNPTYAPPKNGTHTFHMSPGIYGNVTVKSGATVIMDPGIYYVHGGQMNVAAGATVSGDGVMFYDMPNNYFTLPAGASVTLSPPVDGVYRGISVFEPRDITNEIHIITDGNITMSGALYAQAGEFDIRPTLASTVYNFGGYICDQAEWGPPGNVLGTINLNPSTSAPTKRPLLVE